MSELPRGWVEATLRDLSGDISYGFTTSAGAKSGKPRLLRITDLQNNSVDWDGVPFCSDEPNEKFDLVDGDIVVARTGATTGKNYLISTVPERTVFASYLIRIRTVEHVEARYISEFMKSPKYWDHVTTVSKGVAQPGANATVLGNLEVPLPPPPEQQRIVRKLDTLSARTTTARTHLTAIAKLVEKYKRGVYDFHFANAGARVALGTIAKVGTGATPKKGNPRFYDLGNVPWVTSGAVNAKTVNEPSGYITETALTETNCKLFPAGSLLMAMYGEGKTRGQVARLGIEAATNQALAVIHEIDGERVDVDYLYRFLDSMYLEIRELAEGGVQPNLSLGKVKSFELPLPSLEEQREIVRRIETAFARIDRLAAEAEKALKLTDRLDQRILAKAFAGELVPQDPTDEPATNLLARIREARATAPYPNGAAGRKPPPDE